MAEASASKNKQAKKGFLDLPLGKSTVGSNLLIFSRANLSAYQLQHSVSQSTIKSSFGRMLRYQSQRAGAV